MVPIGTERAEEDTSREQGLRISDLQGKPSPGRPVKSLPGPVPGEGLWEEGPRLTQHQYFLPKAPGLSPGWSHAAHPAWTRRACPGGPSALGSRWCPGEQCCKSPFFCLPHSVLLLLKQPVLGDRVYHSVQRCKQVSQCFKGICSCDFSQ